VRRPRRRREPNLRRAERTFLESEAEGESRIFGGEELLEGDPEGVELFVDERPRPVEPPPRRRRGGETARRLVVALPWIAFAIAITIAGGLVFALAMVALGLIGLREYFVMAARQRPIQIAAFLALPGMVMAAHFGTAFNVLLVATAAFPLLFIFGADRKHRDGITVSMAVTLLGVVWIGLPLVHAVLLRDLPLHGAALLIDVLVGTFVTDTAAYATGRMFGSHRFAPRLSPNKTIEGLIGGFVIGTMGFWFAGLYQDWLSGVDALIIGAAVAAVAPLGDLFESMLKRDLGRKDTGTLFGPHGGLLDRLDAVFFTVVAGYYLSVLLVY
jgi:phosphatidate cytidylyltransferase